jgi:hypothetical protein
MRNVLDWLDDEASHRTQTQKGRQLRDAYLAIAARLRTEPPPAEPSDSDADIVHGLQDAIHYIDGLFSPSPTKITEPIRRAISYIEAARMHNTAPVKCHSCGGVGTLRLAEDGMYRVSPNCLPGCEHESTAQLVAVAETAGRERARLVCTNCGHDEHMYQYVAATTNQRPEPEVLTELYSRLAEAIASRRPVIIAWADAERIIAAVEAALAAPAPEPPPAEP